MSKYQTIMVLGLGLIVSVLASQFGFPSMEKSASGQAGVIEYLPVAVEGNFARAEAPIPFEFPKDHGAHNDFQTEWWYYTGNLATESGRRFGYQLTFFRRAVVPPEMRIDRPSDWSVEQVYLAHFSLTDVQTGQFYANEKIGRGAAGLAGAVGEPAYQVWLDEWQVVQVGENEYLLQAKTDQVAVELQLINRKGEILQGEEGYSRKGEEAGNASYYISQTRLETRGKITVSDIDYTVSGLSWMDHEFSTSALGEDQVGWDWFSLQLNNDTEIMLFTLRKEDGSIDRFSSATLILADGRAQRFNANQFIVEVKEQWLSPKTGAVYPSRWQIFIPEVDILLDVRPLIPDQELVVSYIYWEGAVFAQGNMGDRAVSGYGYVELTGYGQSMRGRF
ncbi:lipocalin-like domain-containing protein [Bellilinea sp.]|uniref:lipocalin-like domain-containing protein n=1 Tax=Bellilinea sp. TaxID=2838785 RepID=UPI002ADE1320|nr:lipocalin-like domain-containing protein [Bellilinea sp.]